ncbi:hypothetical protein [Streptomyces sp. NPDC057877]|uniref:hypothetical protein n=1 Tax=Streptomyces sp. NPDC057877 TaxID=3346269 RepID=UPI0036BB637C
MNVRLLALAAVVACVVALPLAMASAGPVGDRGHPAARPGHVTVRPDHTVVRPYEAEAQVAGGGGAERGAGGGAERGAGADAERGADADADADAKGAGSADPADPADPATSPLTLGLGLATAARCGPELTSPEGIEAQTCVLMQGEDAWGRTYYRNATGGALDAVLTLMGPDGRTVQMRCGVGAEDGPGTCDTPPDRGPGQPGDYSAVAEFAARDGRGPLLLRSGSNSTNSEHLVNSTASTGS